MVTIICSKCGGEIFSGIANRTTGSPLKCSCPSPSYTVSYDLSTLQGWECPRCHKINSPYIQSCNCPVSIKMPDMKKSDNMLDCPTCLICCNNANMQLAGLGVGFKSWRCTKCGNCCHTVVTTAYTEQNTM
jgi:hypothetical protein